MPTDTKTSTSSERQVTPQECEDQPSASQGREFSLLGTLAARIASTATPDELISNALAQIATGLGLELCLFGSVDERQITITHSHATTHPLAATQAISLTMPVPITPLPEHNRVCSEEEEKKLLAIIKGISPQMAAILQSALCLIRPRFYGEVSILILADTRPRQDLEPLEPLMNHVADIIITRLDSMMLHDSLKAVNRRLEMRVAERTGELLRVNEALRHEIADRKRAEMELVASETRYRTLVDNLPVGVTAIDADNRILMINRTQAAWFGKPAEFFFGALCYQQFRGRDQPCPDCPGAISTKTGMPAMAEWEGDDAGGFPFPVRVRTVPLSNGDEAQRGFIEVVEDISELRDEEKKRVRFMKKMLHIQKLESLAVLAGGIAHDFNNILMVILGHAELAKMTLPPTTPVRDNLIRIEQAAQKAADLSRQMLTYAGRGQFVVETVDLNRMIGDMKHLLQVSISKKAVLRFNLAENLPAAEVDVTQIRQILMNLVINASEAIGDQSGIIAVSTGATMIDRSFLADSWLDETLEEGLYVFIEVADSGCGMDSDTAKRVFDPFFSTKFTGRGLGMAAALGIARGHNGTIKLRSEPGKGSAFKLILPASTEQAAMAQRQSSENNLIQGSGTILLVDDEETLRALGQDMLITLGFTVIPAEDGRKALEQFRANHEKIVAVLLDLTMPHMDGEETYRELRKLCPDLKIIMSSGYNEVDVCQRFLGQGLSGFIQKPYTLSELSAVLSEVLENADTAPPR